MDPANELVKPLASRMASWHWSVVSLILAFYLGFLDTLLCAALLGYVGLQVPAYLGVPTTMSGYFFTGFLLVRYAPPGVRREILVGTVICAVLFMLGFAGLKHGLGWLFVNFIVIPAAGAGLCYLGMEVAQKRLQKKPA